MADQIVVLNEGRVEQMGAPLDLYDQPANVFVAGFIGSPAMNLIAGRIVATDGGLAVDIAGTRLQVPNGSSVTSGQEVICGIRPEHLTLAETGLSGEVLVVEPTGAEMHVLLRATGTDVTAVFRDRLALVPGQAITVAAISGTMHLFDKTTGLRL